MIELERKTLVVSISGASSSGKTTLSRLLCDIFPNTFILHEDDFPRDRKDVPIKEGLEDWDCPESLSIEGMVAALDYIKKHGTLPPHFMSKESQNEAGEHLVRDASIARLRARVRKWTEQGNPGHAILGPGPTGLNLCILDGFLLYSNSMSALHRYMDIKLFLRVSHASARARREARAGYAMVDGFWRDPPGYVDKIVWPNYVAEHQWMFENGDVEGRVKEDVLRDAGIETQAGRDVDMEATLEWAVETLMKNLEKLAAG